MNVEITNINNIQDKHVVSVRKLKIARLRPDQIGELPMELENTSSEKGKEKS